MSLMLGGKANKKQRRYGRVTKTTKRDLYLHYLLTKTNKTDLVVVGEDAGMLRVRCLHQSRHGIGVAVEGSLQQVVALLQGIHDDRPLAVSHSV